jgi:hypothetical protein
MTEAEFRRSLRQTLPLLDGLAILRPPMHFPKPSSSEFKRVSHSASSSYADVYLSGLKNRDYTFLLEDYSYFHFLYYNGTSEWGVRYGYYPNPFPVIDFADFLQDFEVAGNDPEAAEFYEQLLSEQQPRDGVVPLRYEVDFPGHRPLRHACAHLHSGHNSPMRLPVERMLTPKAFVLFVAKHHFPLAWNADDGGVPNVFDDQLRAERRASGVLPEANFTTVERQEFFLC